MIMFFLMAFHLRMSRRKRVRDEKVDNIVFLRRVEEGLLEGSRTVIECPDLCLESFVILFFMLFTFSNDIFGFA